jgi:signal recognition particle receptor subunit beta
MEILVIGAEGAGKSLFIKRISESINNVAIALRSSEATVPTVGVELAKFVIDDEDITLREVGSSMYTRWDSYVKDARGVIFVCDVSDAGGFSSTLVLMHEALMNSIVGNTLPTLIILNKMDLIDNEGYAALVTALRLDALQRDYARICVIEGNCMANHEELCSQVSLWIRSFFLLPKR